MSDPASWLGFDQLQQMIQTYLSNEADNTACSKADLIFLTSITSGAFGENLQ